MNISIISVRSIRQIFATIAVLALVFSPFANVQLASANHHQIRICHANGGGTYSAPSPNKSQIYADMNSTDTANAHGSFVVGVHPDDIIPPFSAGSQGANTWGDYPGKNWDAEGQVIWNNNCAVPAAISITALGDLQCGVQNLNIAGFVTFQVPTSGDHLVIKLDGTVVVGDADIDDAGPDGVSQPWAYVLNNVSVGNHTLEAFIYDNGPTPYSGVKASDVENFTIDECSADVDLAVDKVLTSGDSTPDEGDSITYTITVTNNGADAATNVVVTDTLEAGLTLTDATPDETGTNPYTWTIPSIAGGGGFTVITVVATVDMNTAGETLTNSVSVEANEEEDDTTNNSDSVDITVNIPPIDYPSVTVIKQTNPDQDSADFSFLLNGNALATLSDGEQASQELAGANVYTLTEASLEGWALTDVSCVDESQAVFSATEIEGGVSLNLAMGNDVACTFTNTKLGTITVVKEVADDAAGSFDFTLNGNAFATLEDGEQETSDYLAEGEYTIAEDVPDGWNYPEISCTDGSQGDDGEVIVDLGVGENVTCTYTNSEVPPPSMGTIIVQKIVNAIDSTLNSFHFDVTWDDLGFDLGNGDSESTDLLVDEGPFSVTEDEVAGWDTDVVCQSTEDTQVTNLGIALVDGETVTCVFTNTELPECSNGINDDSREDDDTDFPADPGCENEDDNDESDPLGSLTVIKVATGEQANADQVFDFSVTGQDDFELASSSDPKVFTGLDDGDYTVSESEDLSRWELTSLQCYSEYGTVDQEPENDNDQDTENSSATVHVGIGEDVTCIFTNEYTPRDSGSNEETITVRKEVTDGSDLTEAFTFDVEWLGDGIEDEDISLTANTESESDDLSADESYRIEEVNLPSGWDLEDVFCSSNLHAEKGFSMDEGENDMEVFLEDGEHIVCTFTNDQDRYEISGQVWHDADGDTIIDEGESILSGWIVRATNGEGADLFTETDAEGFYYFNVPEGTWTITEDVQGGWNQTSPVANSGSHIVTFPAVSEEMTLLDSMFNFLIPTAHAAVMGGAAGLNFGNLPQPSYSQGSYGGGNGTRISLRDGGGDSDDDDEPEGQVLGEATSTLPVGAPNTGKGGASVSFEIHALAAILASRRSVRATNGN